MSMITENLILNNNNINENISEEESEENIADNCEDITEENLDEVIYDMNEILVKKCKEQKRITELLKSALDKAEDITILLNTNYKNTTENNNCSELQTNNDENNQQQTMITESCLEIYNILKISCKSLLDKIQEIHITDQHNNDNILTDNNNKQILKHTFTVKKTNNNNKKIYNYTF